MKSADTCRRAMLGAAALHCVVLLSVMLVHSPAQASAAPPEVERSLINAQLVGEAPYQILGLHLFDAALWSNANDFAWEQPFALTLTYRRSFSARALANRGVHEMARRGVANTDGLRTRLETCFADVRAGDRITGVSTGANTAVFYFNGRQRCEIDRRGFSRAFFGIWLDASSGDSRFRDRLLGGE